MVEVPAGGGNRLENREVESLDIAASRSSRASLEKEMLYAPSKAGRKSSC